MALLCPGCAAPLPARASVRGIDRLHGTPGSFEVLVCAACRSGRTVPVVSSDELASFYPDEYEAHHLAAGRPRSPSTLLGRLRSRRALRRTPLRMLRDRPPGRLLDVGSGRGDLGVDLQQEGWQVTGVEPSAAACEEARSRGVPTEQGTFGTAASRLSGGFDAVVFQHSLEHVVEPAEDLLLARALLADGGLLLVSVPNFGSWQSRRFRTSWFHLDLPRHRSHFSRQGLEALLRRTGFVPLTLETSTSAEGLPMSLQYRVLGRRRLQRGPALYLGAATAILFVPLVVGLDTLARSGDLLHAIAVSPAGHRQMER
jgi:SAM-dependent methyltransferase